MLLNQSVLAFLTPSFYGTPTGASCSYARLPVPRFARPHLYPRTVETLPSNLRAALAYPTLGMRLRGREAMGNGAFRWPPALLPRALPSSFPPIAHRRAAIGKTFAPWQLRGAGLLARRAMRCSRVGWRRGGDRRAAVDDLPFVGQSDSCRTALGLHDFCADRQGGVAEVARACSSAGSFRRCGLRDSGW